MTDIDNHDEHDIQPFVMKQLKRPVVFALAFFSLAIAVLIVECVIYKWTNWRNRELFLICHRSNVQIHRILFRSSANFAAEKQNSKIGISSTPFETLSYRTYVNPESRTLQS